MNVFTNLCKEERDNYVKNLIKRSNSFRKSPIYKKIKCDNINDFKKREKCKVERYKKYLQTPVGKKDGNKEKEDIKKIRNCQINEIKKRGCLEYHKKYLQSSKKIIKVMTKSMKCLFTKDKEKEKTCRKEFEKYSKQPQIQKIDKDYKSSIKEYSKCMKKNIQ